MRTPKSAPAVGNGKKLQMPRIDRSELFSDKDRNAIAEALQPSLYDLSAMMNITKQVHWNVFGKDFRPIHLHLDEIFEELEEAVDAVAERMVAVGISPSGQAPEISKHSRIPTAPLGFLPDVQAIDVMTERMTLLCQFVRADMDKIEDVDAVTADLMHGVVEAIEKHQWMLRAQRG